MGCTDVFVTAQKRMGGEFAGPLIKKTEKRVDWLKKGKRVSINSKKIVNFAAGKPEKPANTEKKTARKTAKSGDVKPETVKKRATGTKKK